MIEKNTGYEIYLNAPGETPMRHCRTIDPAAFGVSESEAPQVLDICVGVWNELGRKVKSQIVVVQDGMIVAVEPLSSGELVWTT